MLGLFCLYLPLNIYTNMSTFRTVNLLTKNAEGEYNTADISFITGKEQEIISDPSILISDKLPRALVGVVKRVGDCRVITEQFLKGMFSGDLRRLAEQVHLFTMDDPETFTFTIPYSNAGGLLDKLDCSIDMFHKVDEPVMDENDNPVIGLDGNEKVNEVIVRGFKFSDYTIPVSSYLSMTAEDRTIELTLPISEKVVVYTVPTYGEEVIFGKGLKKGSRINSSLRFALRNLRYRLETASDNILVKLDTSTLHAKDLKYLAEVIEKTEGDLYSAVIVELPKDATEEVKNFPIDVISLPDFFCL